MVRLGLGMNISKAFSKRGGFPSSPKFGGFQELELDWENFDQRPPFFGKARFFSRKGGWGERRKQI